MGETAASNPGLQVSVSFGRFENDSLSWERWSSFSPNKYLEEVEKCATPGSVAQKKAYFEAHYKKIAARKAELLAQEKQSEKDSSRSEDQNGMDLSGSSCGASAEFDVSNTQGNLQVVKPENSSVDEISGTCVDNSEEEVVVSRDYSSAEGKNEEMESRSHSSHQIEKPEEVVCVRQEESLENEVEDVKEISHVVYTETANAAEVEVKDLQLDHTREVETKDLKLDHPKESKVTSVNKESNAAKTKKKSTLPASKASQFSTPRSSKPASTPTKTSTSASASSTKKGNSPSLSRRQVNSSGESRKVANKSLHMSMSLGPSSNPDPAPHNTTRKSFIMEKMGDKDIVRRAFKTFQNNSNQPKTSVNDRSLVKTQVSSTGTMSKVPNSAALQKENGRPTKVESIDRRSGNSIRTTSAPKKDSRAEKGKEPFRKIEEKSSAKVLERTRLQSKLKEEKEAEMKKIKHNFKATPLPAFYRGQKASKSHPEKGDAKTENPR